MISLTLYILLWILALIFFGASFLTYGGKRIIFNVISFILFFIIALIVDVTTVQAIEVNNTIQYAKIHIEGVSIFQYISWIFLSITIIRGIQHAYLTFSRSRGDE
ncbi:hypothetical protein ACPB8Q_04990 [Methanocaldococcus indicus]|uniref:hypothetical protein n=1 Tax=Methanocaldococcus indicus TaxID=213231 RepID=UPI003C6CEB4D